MALINTEDEEGIPPDSASAHPTSYANALKTRRDTLSSRRRFPFMVLDLECDHERAPLSWSELADFVFDELKIKKMEIAGINTIRGDGKATVRVQTHQEINVKERFGEGNKFERSYGGKSWMCSVRVIQRLTPLRYLHVPDDVSVEDLAQATKEFATLKSTIECEILESKHDPRLSGLPNGHMMALVLPTATIPEFITIGLKKVRVIHRDQVRRCYRCHEVGHFRNECSLGKVPGTEQEIIAAGSTPINVQHGNEEASSDLPPSSESISNVTNHMPVVLASTRQVLLQSDSQQTIIDRSTEPDNVSDQPKSESVPIELKPSNRRLDPGNPCSISSQEVVAEKGKQEANKLARKKKKNDHPGHTMSTRGKASSSVHDDPRSSSGVNEQTNALMTNFDA